MFHIIVKLVILDILCLLIKLNVHQNAHLQLIIMLVIKHAAIAKHIAQCALIIIRALKDGANKVRALIMQQLNNVISHALEQLIGIQLLKLKIIII